MALGVCGPGHGHRGIERPGAAWAGPTLVWLFPIGHVVIPVEALIANDSMGRLVHVLPEPAELTCAIPACHPIVAGRIAAGLTTAWAGQWIVARLQCLIICVPLLSRVAQLETRRCLRPGHDTALLHCAGVAFTPKASFAPRRWQVVHQLGSRNDFVAKFEC